MKALTITTLVALAVVFLVRVKKEEKLPAPVAKGHRWASDESRYDIYDFVD